MNYLIFLLPGLLLAALLLYIAEYYRRTKNALFLDTLGQKMGQPVKYGWYGARLEGIFDGENISVSYLPQHRRWFCIFQASRLSIGAPHETHGEFYVTHKTDGKPETLPFKWRPRVETGNSLFDKDFSIYSPYPPFVQTNLKDGEKRQAIRRLFTMGAKWIHFDGQSIQAAWEPCIPADQLDEDFLRETLARLRAVTKNIQKAVITQRERESQLYAVLWAMAAIFLATVVLSFILIYNV